MILDGKLTAKNLRAQLAVEVTELKTKASICPKLVVILVGNDPASQVYVKNKVRQTQETGMVSNEIKLAEETSQEELLKHLHQLNQDSSVHGILVQLPLTY
mgnify:FL=1